MSTELNHLPSISASTALAWGACITLVMGLEMRYARWRPFFWGTALLTLCVPLITSVHNPLPWASLFEWRDLPWKRIGLVFVLLFIWEAVLFSWLYEKWLAQCLPVRRQTWSMDEATDAARALAHRISPRGEAIAYGILIFIWAPFAENLFYWGFLFHAMHTEWSPSLATFWVVALFAARHGLHFLPVKPLPLPAMAAFALSVAVPAALNCLLFAETGSLFPLMILHVLMNLVLSGMYWLRKSA